MNEPSKDRSDWYTQEALSETARIITITAAELQVHDQKPDVVQILLDIVSRLNHEAIAYAKRSSAVDELPVAEDYHQLLALVQNARLTEADLSDLYRKMVDLILTIPRPVSHSTGHYVTIYTHPNGHTIKPDFPAYTIVNGEERHSWGTWNPSGAVSGSVFFELQDTELTIHNRRRLVSLVKFLTLQ